MCHKIRAALIEPEEKLGGIVEIDETYVGGKDKNRHWDKKSGTQGRGYETQNAGHRRGEAQGQRYRPRRHRHRRRYGQKLSSTRLFPTALACSALTPIRSISGLGYRYRHGVVDHKAGQHVVGAIHTNTIEGFWSLIKRGIVGSYHKVSKKYLPLYVAEFQFRYNNRQNPDIFGAAVARC